MEDGKVARCAAMKGCQISKQVCHITHNGQTAQQVAPNDFDG